MPPFGWKEGLEKEINTNIVRHSLSPRVPSPNLEQTPSILRCIDRSHPSPRLPHRTKGTVVGAPPCPSKSGEVHPPFPLQVWRGPPPVSSPSWLGLRPFSSSMGPTTLLLIVAANALLFFSGPTDLLVFLTAGALLFFLGVGGPSHLPRGQRRAMSEEVGLTPWRLTSLRRRDALRPLPFLHPSTVGCIGHPSPPLSTTRCANAAAPRLPPSANVLPPVPVSTGQVVLPLSASFLNDGMRHPSADGDYPER